MTITYNPHNGDFYAVQGPTILAQGSAPIDLDLKDFLMYLLFEIRKKDTSQ